MAGRLAICSLVGSRVEAHTAHQSSGFQEGLAYESPSCLITLQRSTQARRARSEGER